MHDGAGQLARHETQNLFVAVAVANVFGIGLHHQGTESLVSYFQRHAHPVERSRPVAFDFATPLHLLEHFGRGQQRFAGAQQILRQAASQFLWGGRWLLLVHEIREAEHFGGRIVERHVEVPGVHEFIHNAVDGGKELLQIARGAALFGHAIECRTERLGAFVLGNVPVNGIEADGCAIHH